MEENVVVESRNVEHTTIWRKEGYHEDYTKSSVLPDDREDITEYVELMAMLDLPGEVKKTTKRRIFVLRKMTAILLSLVDQR